MKKAKPHATANQFEQAVAQQIEHARGMNVPKQAISSATSFCLLVLARLFGEKREMCVELQRAYTELRNEAIDERRAELRRQQAREADQRASRIILPGQSRDPRRN